MRCQQQVRLPIFPDCDSREILTRLRYRVLPIDVPRVIAADDGDLLLVPLKRRAAASARRIIPLPARELFA